MPPKKLRILIVDDKKDSADVTALAVSYFGHETVVACSGKEAINLAAKVQPDVIFMDITLPDMDGRDAALMIKDSQISPDSKIICFSCHNVDYQKTQKHESAFDYYMQKGTDIFEIKEVLEGMG